MARQTIDFGIDLGTTNSSIAALDKNGPSIFRNNEGNQITPSAVYIDKQGAIRVGDAAKDRIVSEPNDAVSEFKLWMGTEQKKMFARVNRLYSPEELSAEVLKSLKQDVKKNTGEEVEAAVITVPAAFDSAQSIATERAAKLAGIRVSPLLQEPIAAALAYGFQTDRENAFWLVYDFGGGTFDAAVIHVRDGMIQVVNHGGDNDLGGKLIDWAIVDQIFVPAILQEHRLSNFDRNNEKWRSAFAKLKNWAERAKISLSKDQNFDLVGEFVGISDDGKPVQLDCAVSRAQVEALLQPHLAKTINICRRVLAEKKLSARDIERVLLVGGPTYMPYLRQVLPDEKLGLGIPLEFGIDPLTVVAQGAALFAGGQILTKVKSAPEAGEYSLELDYKPIASETEPLVGGRVIPAARKSLTGFSVRFTNSDARPPWNSGNTFTTKLTRNELKEIDFSAHGIPDDAVLLQASFYPQRRECCNPLFSPGRYLPQMLARKVLLFGQPLEGNAQEEVIAVAVTWVPFHNDFKESRIYLTEAFDAWASQKHWSVILPAYVAFEIALIRVVKSAMERRLSNERVADFLRDGLTSSVALNVILPLLCDASSVKHLPAPIRGEPNRLRKLRNELVHDGLAKDAVSKSLAGEMLCASVFGFEYLRYAEGVLNVVADRINP